MNYRSIVDKLDKEEWLIPDSFLIKHEEFLQTLVDKTVEQLHVGNDMEIFSIKDAIEMIKAWESLPEGDYDSETISDWLINDMKPVIDKFRDKIK